MPPLFRRLRTKLTVLYAGLFGVALMLVAAAVYGSIKTNATHDVERQFAASGVVFDRVWALRSQQLEDGASLLSRDFGFREAIASQDAPTIRSALENLRARFGVDLAFTVGTDGQVTAAGGHDAAAQAAAGNLLKNLDEADAAGVMMIGGEPYQTIAAPILAPVLTGWVVFAVRLDEAQMSAQERLSAIPLDVMVFHKGAAGGWTTSDSAARGRDGAFGRFIDQTLKPAGKAQRIIKAGPESVFALVKRLPSIGGGEPAVLVLQYPVAKALSPYEPMLETIGGAALLGFVLLVFGSWGLARSLTRPISALDEAARRLQRGEAAHVSITTRDEMARLAESFNSMADEIRLREEKITHLALHDAETGLPNRLALERAVEAMLERRGAGVLVIAAVGVDRFEHVRGAIGYAHAGSLIAEVGQRLASLGAAEPVARLSSDVLGLMFTAADIPSAARVSALIDRVETPVRLEENMVDVSVTVGLAAFGVHAQSVGELVEKAAIALDQARTAKSKSAVFDEALYGDPSKNLSLMSEMLRGLKDGSVTLHHQPKYDLRRGEVTGVEALVRWRHPTRGPLSPDLFIPMAEETGHIRALTDWVLERAIDDQLTMRAEGREISISINISGRLLSDLAFAESALRAVARAKGKLCFEITETAVMENPEVALQVIDRLAAAGVRISIDDYGSGLSSLAYLKQIRASELKIDKAFVMGVSNSSKDALLVRSTIDLAHSLGMEVTAEGVETATGATLLTGMGCDLAQGYLIARPMPLSDLLAFLAQEDASERRYG